MNKLEQIKKSTKETVDEISKVAKAHVELAKTQYKEYVEKKGDPVERMQSAVRGPLTKGRETVVTLSKDVNAKTDALVKKVNTQTHDVTKRVSEKTASVTKKVSAKTEDVSKKVMDKVPKKAESKTAEKPKSGA